MCLLETNITIPCILLLKICVYGASLIGFIMNPVLPVMTLSNETGNPSQ